MVNLIIRTAQSPYKVSLWPWARYVCAPMERAAIVEGIKAGDRSATTAEKRDDILKTEGVCGETDKN
jgi:hypothetical protein